MIDNGYIYIPDRDLSGCNHTKNDLVNTSFDKYSLDELSVKNSPLGFFTRINIREFIKSLKEYEH